MVEALPAACTQRRSTRSQYAEVGVRAMPMHDTVKMAMHTMNAWMWVSAEYSVRSARFVSYESSSFGIGERAESHWRCRT